MTTSLTSRFPTPAPGELVAQLVPPPRFQQARLDNYIPDPDYPSQEAAKQSLQQFASRLTAQPSSSRGGVLSMFGRKKGPAAAHGLYLDGGFGVGKTHLLTALFHIAPGRPLYGTFVEYTNLIGVLGFTRAVEEFSTASVLCIDEFELDDVGDTLLMTRMIRELSDRGVPVVATSNTLPDALGEGRFAAQDFLREIQAMADRFDVLRIDGLDYREKDRIDDPPQLADDQVRSGARGDRVSLDDFEPLAEHLREVHPSRYGAMIDGIERCHIVGMEQVSEHNRGLRLVVLIDRLYDREVPVALSGVRVPELFTEDLLNSGYRKKYLRCLSRLGALQADGARALV
ncbi:cell division protein ZapE [Helcobacillus massiliensis]|uniref:cell division protein ZapE n=1 Tax=Helcobacillus massiliensis TaxID=521392 RepID=UPI0021A2F2E2|nr:cell division protein ZapE [Helcobacillus massiliensis]MCT1557216.1 cell division protein ZapE [Helcobacillus massiliensis]MCT2036934.1 cell division protein ZapE [Helcobacillus massiliensis]MCT2332676.1 cell division protein ZapE [Helcobacillus massiliensis]